MTAYQSDPMLQSLYHKYDIKPFRQTKDGSTYLYDPFSFSEIRTFESKDPSELQIAAQLGAAVLGSFVLGPAAQATIGSMVATTTGSLALGATAANMATQAAIATAMGGDPLEAALMGGIPVGNVPIPFTGGQTLTGLTGGKVDFLLGATDPVSVALRASLAGATNTIPGSGTFTGATPDFNPYINNIAAAASGTTVEAEEENLNIDLANLAALSQQEEAPVTPVTQPEFDDITVDTTVEPIEQPELPLDVAPPVLPTEDSGGGGSSAPTPVETITAETTAEPTASGVTEINIPADWKRDPDVFNGWIHVPSGTKYTGGTVNNNAVFRNTETGEIRAEFTHPEDKTEGITSFDPSLFEDFSRFSNVDANPNGTYEWNGLTVSPEGMAQIVNANPEMFPEPTVEPTEPTEPTVEPTEPTVEPTKPTVEPTEPTVEPTDEAVTDATTTGDDVTGDSGSGSGTGGGTGGGAGDGLNAGMLSGAAAGGKPSVTDLVFSDYVKRYEAPELQKRVLPLQGYQAPQGLFRGLV